MNKENTIKTSDYSVSINFNKVMCNQLEEQIKKDFEEKFSKKEKELQNKLEELTKEKEKLEEELTIAYKEQKKTEGFLKGYMQGVKKMMYLISHKVRQPVANILGLSILFDESIHSHDEQIKIISYMKESALSLDVFTKELTLFIIDLEQEGENKI